MNQIFKTLLAVLLVSFSLQAEGPLFGKTFFNQRTQGYNWARWLSGQAHHTHLCDTDCVNGSFSITPEYGQTFNSKQLGEYFFFNGTNTMRFGPVVNPAVIPTTATAGVDVFARNFFLNDNFDGIVTANPRSKNFIADINFYLGLDEWVNGLYFRVDIPINWTSWDMMLTQEATTSGDNIAINKLGNTVVGGSPAPRNNIEQGWQGSILAPSTFPYVKQEMLFARIDGKKSKTSVADITFILGYDVLCNECAHLGFNFQVIAPTGTRPDAQFVFEPIVGNGRHVEVGGGLSGSFEIWNNGCDQSFSIFGEGAIFHMFSAKQKRTFDLKNNGIGSRYLLLKRFDQTGAFANEIVFGPNVLTREVKVRNDMHGEAALMFDYQNGGFTFDVGYNIWGRTKEKVTISDTIPARTFGIAGNTDTTGASMNLTQSNADIKGNMGATDATAVFISTEDLDVESGTHPGAYSHKLFTHLAYTWENYDYLPFVGLGGEVEFAGRKNRAFDQWGVWIKGGFTFA